MSESDQRAESQFDGGILIYEHMGSMLAYSGMAISSSERGFQLGDFFFKSTYDIKSGLGILSSFLRGFLYMKNCICAELSVEC